MSTFEVKIRTITTLEPHPNADRLECVVIGGYRAVVAKGIHTVGDKILYIPEDSVFTDIDVAKFLEIDSYLTGKQKNRVKAVKLRGLLSQGIVLPFRVFRQYLEEKENARFLHDLTLHGVRLSEERERIMLANLVIGGNGNVLKDRYQEPVDYDHHLDNRNWADFLKIEKYEEPIPIEMAGQVRRWPSFLPKYDLENIKRPESMGLLVAGEPVVMTEKLHGTNMTIAIGEGLEEGEEVFVCSRNNALKESDTNVYWRAAKKYELGRKIKLHMDGMNALYVADGLAPKIESISLHGEVVGVQDLKYGQKGGDIGFYAFDVMINGKFLDHDMLVEFCYRFDIPMVPVLYEGPYDYDELVKVASGKTTLGADHIREGGVVRPVKERLTHHGDRVVLKVVSDEYLTRKGGSELH